MIYSIQSPSASHPGLPESLRVRAGPAGMGQRCCVFIDGENLRHSIVDLFHDNFDRNDYLPKFANWGALYDWLVEQVDPNAERVRAYWYVVEALDNFPYQPFPKDIPRQESMLKKNPSWKAIIDPLVGQQRDDKIRELVDELYKRSRSIKSRFDGWRQIQEWIAGNHDAIEFRRAGAIRYDLFEKMFGDEKAVDVRLATDLIVLKDIYDTAVIVSGDQDYVPAVQVVKDSGKRVVNVSFETRNGKLLPGGARRLNMHTDKAFQVPYSDMKAHLKL